MNIDEELKRLDELEKQWRKSVGYHDAFRTSTEFNDALRNAYPAIRAEIERLNLHIKVQNAQLAHRQDIIDRLRKVEAALPKTRDGQPIVPGQIVYQRCGDGGVFAFTVDSYLIARRKFNDYDSQDSTRCYSTEAAALAAKENRNEQNR